MEFLVMPQLTHSLVECFSASGDGCTCNGSNTVYTCTCHGDGATYTGDICEIRDGCVCRDDKACDCNIAYIPVCIVEGCPAKTCVKNYSPWGA